MRTATKCLLLLFAISVLTGIAALLTSKQLQASSSTSTTSSANNPVPVTVTNTPLPVQGSVGISGTPSVTVANTTAVPVQTAGASAVMPSGQFAGSHVRLTLSPSNPASAIGPDGTAQAFSIPPGKLLVITDLEWFGRGAAAGDAGGLALSVGSSRVLVSTATTGSNLSVGASEHLTGGLVVSQVPDMYVLSDVAVDAAFVQGYFVPNQ